MVMVYRIRDQQLILSVTVRAGAKKSILMGVFNECLKVAIQSPPVDGAANAALIKFLSGELNIPQSEIKIVRGTTSKIKQIMLPLCIKENLDSIITTGYAIIKS